MDGKMDGQWKDETRRIELASLRLAPCATPAHRWARRSVILFVSPSLFAEGILMYDIPSDGSPIFSLHKPPVAAVWNKTRVFVGSGGTPADEQRKQ